MTLIATAHHLLHAIEKGVCIEPRASWLQKQRLLDEFEILPDVSPGLTNCLARVGQPYDSWGVVRAGFAVLLKRFWSTLQLIGPANNSAHTCASFVMMLDPKGERIPEWRYLHRGVVTPAQLLYAAAGPSFRHVTRLPREV